MNDQVISKIKELGPNNSKRFELQEYCKQQFDQIVKFIERRVLYSDGECLLGYILNGLSDNNNASSRNQAKIIELVLKTMRQESTSLTHCGDIVSKLSINLPRMMVEDLMQWSNDSVQSIVDDSDVNMIWRDILPRCLDSILTNFDTVQHCGTEMSSAEYKEQCVHTLCQCRWNNKQLVQLVAMFKDMQLSTTGHLQVVNKICSYIIDIPPDTLPPLVHQLMKLCATHNLQIVLGHLSHYFNARLYSKLEPPPQDSESTTMDIDDIVPYSAEELSRCLSTCIYHITQEAVELELIRKYIKMWPKTQMLRAPFIIDLVLALSDRGLRSVCLDAIKSAIELRITDELRCKEYAWARAVIPPDVDVASLLKVLTAESANHRQLTVVALINLAFSLLAVSRVKPTAYRCWSHGKLILVRLCKAQGECASYILSTLRDKLAADAGISQYADCLYVLCKLAPVSVERCTELRTILEVCRPSEGEGGVSTAATVLDAVHPLLAFSTRTRDTLFIVCRKGLYDRDSRQRCLAISGFLTVLRHTRLSRSTLASSQTSSEQYAHSANSYLTQVPIDLHAIDQGATVSRVHNESVCMEVVSILRLCLMQDASVKQLLYTSIYDCVKEKPALHECILEMLCEHLIKYLPESAASQPLVWDKCVQMTGATAVLSEPIAHLLQCLAQFIQKEDEDSLEDILMSQTVETASAHLKSTITANLDKFCAHDNLGNIDLEDLTDLTPESKAKCIKVQQILQCYESLIAYKIMTWTAISTDVASTVYRLYKDCNQLLDLVKGTPKTGKKGSKSLNETKETNKSQKSQKSQKENNKGPTKVANLLKDRSGPFKPLPCVWSVRLCARIVQLLYSDNVPWCSVEQRNQIIGRRDFHHWSLRCVQSVLCGHPERRAIHHVVGVATVMYQRCVCRFQAMCDFDDQTALGCLELFKTCLTILFSPNYGLEMDNILSKITGTNPDTPASTSIATILEHIHTALMHISLESELGEQDVMVKRLLAALTGVAAFLLEVPTQSCAEMSNVIVKLEDYARTSKQDWLALLPALLTASCREQQEAQLLEELLVKLTVVLGRIEEDDTSAGADESSIFPSIDCTSGHVALSAACGHVVWRARCTQHLLTLARHSQGHTYTHTAVRDREQKEHYKAIVIQLCQLTNWTSRITKLRCQVGTGSDKVLGACVRLYSLLASLAKQIDVATAQVVKFERLLKLSGKKLSAITDKFIEYIEASITQQSSASKVLRDTKLIPRLVMEAEQYCKRVLILAGKAKLDWQHYLSLATARDFRIDPSVLQKVLNTRDNEDASDDADDDDQDIHEATTDQASTTCGENGTQKKRRRVS